MSAGTLEVLNVGAGDLRITVTEESRATARAMITDMLRQGYAIVVEDEDGVARICEAYDEEHDEYIVAALPSARRFAAAPVACEDRQEPAARVKRKAGSWAEVTVDGKPLSTSRTLRTGEAREIAERINAGEVPDDVVREVLTDRRRSTKTSRATAIGRSAGG